jgi:hypothetical protein
MRAGNLKRGVKEAAFTNAPRESGSGLGQRLGAQSPKDQVICGQIVDWDSLRGSIDPLSQSNRGAVQVDFAIAAAAQAIYPSDRIWPQVVGLATPSLQKFQDERGDRFRIV